MINSTQARTRARVVVAAGAAVAVIGSILAAPVAGAAPLRGGVANESKISPVVSAALQADGASDYWVRFAKRADLTAAEQIANWNARGRAVVAALKSTARSTQADVRAYLRTTDAEHEAFWATNAIYISGGTAALANELAAFDEVSQILPSTKYDLPETIPGEVVTEPDSVEWGVTNIKAPQVWSQFDDQGKGIVVANIDTGVQWNHPALVKQYRGKGGNHDYNWFNVQGCPSAPCDSNGHGTHTMGTMVGSDGGSNQIGVAPKAKWIAANGCCPSDQALIRSGQWMLAPTKLNGTKPKPSKRPDIINNSWGTQSPSTDPFMEDVLQDWKAAGIWGQWSNGNIGPGCSTSGSPGSRILNYSAGAYDINNNIADFSSRGPGQSGELKPNISAPGVNVRSSFPGNTYGAISGTSMASPHVAGAVALLWSEVKSLRGDINTTRQLLDDTAIDKSGSCGGTADDNNTYGEGRLDALALVQAGTLLAQQKAAAHVPVTAASAN